MPVLLFSGIRSIPLAPISDIVRLLIEQAVRAETNYCFGIQAWERELSDTETALHNNRISQGELDLSEDEPAAYANLNLRLDPWSADLQEQFGLECVRPPSPINPV